MESTQDGFEFAEQVIDSAVLDNCLDLAQSGLPDLRVANIIKDIVY